MAPVNLENNIREKLEARELKPSSDAWEKMELQLEGNGNRSFDSAREPSLDSARERKIKSRYFIAASVLGLLLVGSVFLNTNSVKVENEVVTTPFIEKDVPQNEIEIVTELSNSSEEIESAEKSKIENKPKHAVENLKPRPVQQVSEVEKKMRKSEVLATTSEVENPVVKEDPIFDAKVDEVVASVKSLQQGNSEVTAEEVETLLTNARRDIQIQKILRYPEIDAMALLEEVEWELDKSFRDKVFDALGEGFQKLRTAISQRND